MKGRKSGRTILGFVGKTRVPKWATIERDHLGAILGPSCAISGPSWTILGPSQEEPTCAQGRHRELQGTKKRICEKPPKTLKVFGPHALPKSVKTNNVEPSWDLLEQSWVHLGTIFGHLMAILGLFAPFWAVLEPS